MGQKHTYRDQMLRGMKTYYEGSEVESSKEYFEGLRVHFWIFSYKNFILIQDNNNKM